MPKFNRNNSRIMKTGLIARSDNGGLGTLSWEFYKNLPFDKTIVVYSGRKEYEWKFPDAIWSLNLPNNDLEAFCRDLDLIVTFETPYNWNLFELSKQYKFKTILIPNYEWTTPDFIQPSLLICPTLLDYQEMPEPKIYLPIPINRDILPFKLRKKAEIFLFNAGRGGVNSRNQAAQVLRSIPLVKSQVKFIIHYQSQLRATTPEVQNEFIKLEQDPRVILWEGDIPYYQNLYMCGDILIHPQKYGSLSLPMLEASSCGMPVIAMDKFPENTFLSRELLVEPSNTTTSVIQRYVTNYNITPEALASKIDEIIMTDITQYSIKADKIANKWSWTNLKPLYLDIFDKLVNNKEIKQSDSDRLKLSTI